MPYTNEDIIDALYRLYEQPMYYEAYKILHDDFLAEDAVHEAFLKLIRNRRKIIDPSSPSVKSYVYKTLRSAALDLYRRQKKQRENTLELDEAMENSLATEGLPQDLPISLLSELPPKFASVMRCLFLDGLSIKETSAVLNISEELVRKRCERARKLLKLTTTNLKKETHHES